MRSRSEEISSERQNGKTCEENACKREESKRQEVICRQNPVVNIHHRILFYWGHSPACYLSNSGITILLAPASNTRHRARRDRSLRGFGRCGSPHFHNQNNA